LYRAATQEGVEGYKKLKNRFLEKDMAGLVSCFSSTTNVPLLVMTAFLFVTVSKGDKCFECNSGQVCCYYDCVDGTSCVGYGCDHDQDCSRYEVESCCKYPGKSQNNVCLEALASVKAARRMLIVPLING